MKRLAAMVFALILLIPATGCRLASRNNGRNTQMLEVPEIKSVTEELKKESPSVHITQSPAEKLMNSLVPYSDVNGCFTALIPQGWAVSTAGFDMLYWIRIYDPANPDLQVFTLLKTECLLSSQKSKSFFEKYRNYELYAMSADMIVAQKVEDFYGQFMEFAKFMAQYEPTYKGFEYPQIYTFEVMEKNPYGSIFADLALDDSVIHASFDDVYTGQKGEGMFTGSLCRGLDMGEAGYNEMYNINAVTASYGEFSEYEALLSTIFGSIQYTDVFISTVMKDLMISAEAAAALNSTLQATSDIITGGWNARQKSYDIISAKQSDATMGYERVYNTETGEVYKAYNGFLDIPDIENYYLPVTDDMYSLPVSGYIER